MAKNFKETLCALYGLPYGAPVGMYTEPVKTHRGMVLSSHWALRIVFYADGRLMSLRLNEQAFSNWPLQWVRHRGANRMIGSPANVQMCASRSEAELFALKGVELDEMTHHYLIAALWSSTTDEGVPLDDMHSVDDITPESKARAFSDCLDFQHNNRALLKKYAARYTPHADAPTWQSQAGHDFWLTRNRHGVGFWDRGMGALGDKLTEAAHAYGEVNLFEDNNGKLGGY